MVGILVKNGVTVVEKHLFSGDISKVSDLVAAQQAQRPALMFEIHQDSDPDWKIAFDTVAVQSPLTAQQTAWATAKASGPAVALTFIAKTLGLE